MNHKANAKNWVRCACLFGSLFICGSVLAAQYAVPYTSAARYDASGRVTGTILPDPDGAGPLQHPATRHTYSNGQLTRTESGQLAYWYDENTPPASWDGFTVTLTKVFAYDHYGRKAVQATLSSPQGSAVTLVQYSYDAKGRVNCKTIRMNASSYSVSNFASLPAACTPVQHATGYDRVTHYTYDVFDQVVVEDRAYGTPLSQAYVTNTYSGPLLKTQKDANGNLTELRYDSTGRLIRRVYPSPTSTGALNEADYNSYTYDANGNLHVERKRNGATITHTYDNSNRLTKKDLSNNTYSGDVFYNYDLRGLTLHSRFGSHSGQGITNTFDGFGNLATSTTTMGGTSRMLSYGYDKNGNRERITHPDKQYFAYTFDDINRVNAVTENATGLLSLTYQPNGRRHKLTRGGGSTTYEFDNVARLETLEQDFAGTANDLANSFTYIPSNQIRTFTVSNNRFRYTGEENRTGEYSVNGLNQYTSIAGKPLLYDNSNGNLGNGNLTSDGSMTYVYDIENRLVKTTGGATSTFTYDPLGRLYQATVNGTTTRFFYDGDALVAEYNSSGTMTRRYVHGDQVDEPWVQYNSASTGSANRRYLHADHQGSVIAHSDASGNLLAKLTYDSFGIPHSANIDRFGYTGQIWFKELGLFHYKARMYSPKLGRFLQTDPIFYADQMNMYAYVGNDPVNKIDPTGMYGYWPGMDEMQAIAEANGQAEVVRTAVGAAVTVLPAGTAVRTGAAAYRAYRFERRLEKVREKLGGWKEEPNSKKTGSRFQDPDNKGNRVRVDKGDPNHDLPRQKVDHVVEQKGGKTIDGSGQEIKPTPDAPRPTHTPEAHVPLDEWLKKR